MNSAMRSGLVTHRSSQPATTTEPSALMEVPYTRPGGCVNEALKLRESLHCNTTTFDLEPTTTACRGNTKGVRYQHDMKSLWSHTSPPGVMAMLLDDGPTKSYFTFRREYSAWPGRFSHAHRAPLTDTPTMRRASSLIAKPRRSDEIFSNDFMHANPLPLAAISYTRTILSIAPVTIVLPSLVIHAVCEKAVPLWPLYPPMLFQPCLSDQ